MTTLPPRDGAAAPTEPVQPLRRDEVHDDQQAAAATGLSAGSAAPDGPWCQAVKADSSPCRARPLVDEPHCLWHSPEHAEEATRARRIGGSRRRKQAAIATAFDLNGEDGRLDVERVIEFSITENLALPNSVKRNAALKSAAMALLEVRTQTGLEPRVVVLEEAEWERAQKEQRGKG